VTEKRSSEPRGRILLALPERGLPAWFDPRLAHYFCGLDLGNIVVQRQYSDNVWGGNFSVKRDALRKVGLSNPGLGCRGNRKMAAAETELVWRIQRAGGRLLLRPRDGRAPGILFTARQSVLLHAPLDNVLAFQSELSLWLDIAYADQRWLREQLGQAPALNEASGVAAVPESPWSASPVVWFELVDLQEQRASRRLSTRPSCETTRTIAAPRNCWRRWPRIESLYVPGRHWRTVGATRSATICRAIGHLLLNATAGRTFASCFRTPSSPRIFVCCSGLR